MLNKVSCFNNTDFDLLKFDVNKSDTIMNFNKDLAKMPHRSDFPSYIPHVTIAYLLSGKSEEYLNKEFKLDNVRIKSIKYSKPNGQNLKFDVY